MALTVTQAFADYTVGQVITDTAQIAAIEATEQVRFVVRTSDPAKPAAAPQANGSATD